MKLTWRAEAFGEGGRIASPARNADDSTSEKHALAATLFVATVSVQDAEALGETHILKIQDARVGKEVGTVVTFRFSDQPAGGHEHF